MAKSMFDYLSKGSSSPKSPATNFLSDHMEKDAAMYAFDEKMRKKEPITPEDWAKRDAAIDKDQMFQKYRDGSGMEFEFKK